jgi:hypothetical protein
MFYPIVLIIASLAFGAPTFSETVADHASSNPDTLTAYVEQYFADTPILAKVAWCESRMRHYGKDGEILRGTVDQDDIGVMQINTRFHEEVAVEMDLDLYTVSGNLGYAKHLYETQGLKPWSKSYPCWSPLAQK